MTSKKGFIKILEAIVASVILLTSLTFFFKLEIKPTEWDSTLLQIRAQDVLYTLVKNGALQNAVQSNNPAIINSLLNDTSLGMLPPTLDYSFEVSGIPNPVIFVGCVCTEAGIDDLKSRLAPLVFSYKRRTIEIRIENDTLNPRNETNVLFLNAYQNLNPEKASLEKFLGRGGTIFMFSDLSQAQASDGYMNTVFGLNWTPGSRTNTGTFYNPENENMTAFKIAKYFRNITGNASETFTFSGSATILADSRTVVTDGSFSLVKVNKEIVDGNGRTVWFSSSASSSQNNNLLKSVIMWASGERFRLDVLQKTPVGKTIKSRLLVGGDEIYEVIVTLWNIFG